MEKFIWRLLVANFLLLTGTALLVMAYVLFANSALAMVGAVGGYILIPLGIVWGLVAIIDHNREYGEEE